MTGNIARKNQTGEAGAEVNGGHFAKKQQSEAGDVIAAPQYTAELDQLHLDPDLVDSVTKHPGSTRITLKAAHPTGGYDSVQHTHDDERDAITFFGASESPAGNSFLGVHRVDGPAHIDLRTGAVRWFVDGREVFADEVEQLGAEMIRFGIAPEDLKSFYIQPGNTWLTLQRPHPTGGWDRVVDITVDVPGRPHGRVTIFDLTADSPEGATRVVHRLDGPATIIDRKETWAHNGQETPAPVS